jgi:hypothetical protein
VPSHINCRLRAVYKADSLTNKVIYGYVGEACADKNWWCRDDVQHLNILKGYLDSAGVLGGWNGRKVEWDYLNTTPTGCVHMSR